MKSGKKTKLKKTGWKIGSAEEFLGLTSEEAAYVDLRLTLSDAVKKRWLTTHLTQQQLACKLASSQSRVAKTEAGDTSVSIDLLVRSLFALGTTRKDLAKMVGAISHR